jgi:uncharacterized Zn-binding protein involved in type VI secretion
MSNNDSDHEAVRGEGHPTIPFQTSELNLGHMPDLNLNLTQLFQETAIMMDIVRFGDATDHGGKVISTSSTMSFDGRFVARKGDEVSCPKHDIRPNLIIEGDESMMDDGVPIARHGYRAVCGCRLISSLV